MIGVSLLIVIARCSDGRIDVFIVDSVELIGRRILFTAVVVVVGTGIRLFGTVGEFV